MTKHSFSNSLEHFICNSLLVHSIFYKNHIYICNSVLFLYLSYFPDQMDCILLKSKHVIEARVYVKHNKHLLHFNCLSMKVKEESEKVGLKLNIQKTKIMASGPITSWQIDGETVETMADFIFLGSKITEDGDCSHEIKRHLLLGRKVMTNLDSILKSRDITLPTKVHLVKAIVFPVVM